MRDIASLGISPAPWKVGVLEGSDENDLVVFDRNNCAVVLMNELKEHRKADSSLIASAPALYEALLEAVDEFKVSNCKRCPWFDTTDRDKRKHKCRCPKESPCMAIEWESVLAKASGESEVEE